ncbi:hypothetical protein L5515_011522 [Caenorhabditis briggsae]|uniref:Uncharacterized protein n=1 Tax=Caenorhabditis briggsae TaxID=6238 RepID=A0AAE9EXM8_CAEBR|nr:hypothetical protein L5515_011522 [Caenorhabditis briggsae]
MDLRTVEAIIRRNSTDVGAYFGFSDQISRDIIIDYSYVPLGIDLVGKWVRVVVRDPNVVCRPVVIIDDILETRLLNRDPEIRIEASYDSRFKNKYEVFHNNFAGFIIDTDKKVQHIDTRATYSLWITRLHQPGLKASWRVSQDLTLRNTRRARDGQQLLRTVDAIVHSVSRDGTGYTAWTRTEKNRITIDSKLCRGYESILGRWVELTLDHYNFVKEDPVLLPDVFETQIKKGITRIRIDFQSTADSEKTRLFYNSYFGNIYDQKQNVPPGENGSWYRGWIIFYLRSGLDTRWRLCNFQNVEGPFSNNTNEPGTSSGGYDNKNHQEYIRSSSDFHRSESPRKISIERFDDEQQYQRRTSEEWYPSNTIWRPSEPLEDRNHYINDRNSPTLYAFNLDGINQQNDDDTRLNRKEIIYPKDKKETTPLSEEEYYTCSEDGGGNYKTTQAPRMVGRDSISPSGPSSVLYGITENETIDRIGEESTGNNVQESTSSRRLKPKTEKEIELTMLKEDFIRMSVLIRSLTKKGSVAEKMMVANFEDYEELMKLIR